MRNQITFGSPATIDELNKVYGSQLRKEEVTPREYPDVQKFLQEKEKSQKESEKVQFIL